MSSGEKTSSGGGFFSTLVIVALLALAIGLYLKVVQESKEGTATVSSTEAAPEADILPAFSVRVVETAEAPAAEAPATEAATSDIPTVAAAPEPAPAASEPASEGAEDAEELAALPSDQMALIKEVFGSQ